jgi:hypothetical protein
MIIPSFHGGRLEEAFYEVFYHDFCLQLMIIIMI